MENVLGEEQEKLDALLAKLQALPTPELIARQDGCAVRYRWTMPTRRGCVW